MSTTSSTDRALVVCESMFGNTRAVADAIADGLREQLALVEVVSVADAPAALDGVDLVVVGGPTHAFSMSRSSTRDAATEQGATAAADVGVREWLAGLARPERPTYAAAFTTRLDRWYAGRATRAIATRLRQLGCQVLATLDVSVTDVAGPVADGELRRARHWGAILAARLQIAATAALPHPAPQR